MPYILITREAAQIILSKATRPVRNDLVPLENGMVSVPVTDDVFAALELRRFPEESTSECVLRVVATGGGVN